MTTTVSAAPTTLAAGWSETNLYSITYDLSSGLIVGLYGAIAPFVDIINTAANTDNHYLGAITQDMYDAIANSIYNPISLAFWNPANSTLKIRKIIVNFGPNTYLDGQRQCIVGLNNTITLIPQCVDQNGAVWNDVTTVQIKNMAKTEFAVSIAGQPTSDYKGTCTNNQPVTLTLQVQGRVTIRFKVLVPELTTTWLSVYPELYAYNSDGLAALNAWAATQPAPGSTDPA
jgi:hypothetical protein